jgi:hypothetical protein
MHQPVYNMYKFVSNLGIYRRASLILNIIETVLGLGKQISVALV